MSEYITRKPEKRLPKFEPLGDTVIRVIDNIGKRNGKPEFETGLEAIDIGLNGLHRSQMTIISARPGVGKTSLACQIAYKLASESVKVAFVSLEMTKESIIERIFCNQFLVNGFDLLIGKVTPQITSKLSLFAARAAELPLYIIDDYCFKENELFTLFEHLEFKPDVLILDHIQHIRAIERKSNWECLTEYLRYLKELSMRNKIATVVLSQINRQGEDRPTLANLKGTGAIEEMADHVLMLHQLKDLKPKGTNFEINIAKNRFGPVGIFDATYRAEYCKFLNEFERI